MTLGRNFRRIAVGYCLLYLHFKLNGFDLLPNFVGWVLFHRAILGLKEERPKLMLLKNFALALGAWSVVEWMPVSLTEELGLSGLPGVGLPGLVFQLMSLYFHFQFLTELAELAGTYQDELSRQDHRGSLLHARTGVTVLQTVSVLLAAIPFEHWLSEWNAEWVETLAAVGLLIFTLVFCVTIVWELFSLAKEMEQICPKTDKN